MRRIATALVIPLLLVSAAACGDGDDGKSSGGTKGGVPSVSGKADAAPEVAKGEGDPPGALKVKVLKEGTGATVAKGDALTANYLGQSWDGKVFDSSWKNGQPATFEIGVGKVVKGWDEGLVGKKVGSRVELVIPPEKGYGANPPEGSGIAKNATLVFVVDIEDSYGTKPKGEAVPQKDASLPKVGTAADGKAPSVTIPKGESAPKKITSQTVIEGTGKAVTAKDTVVANYAVHLWNGQPGGDTWSQNGAQQVPLAQLPGWKESLPGKKVGSRVLIVVPKSSLTEAQQKDIGSDLVFVVDILDVV